MRFVLVSASLLLASPALGQSIYAPPQVSRDVVQQLVRQAMPAPATTLPPATALDGQAGASTDYARADHTHAVKVSNGIGTGPLIGVQSGPLCCAWRDAPDQPGEAGRGGAAGLSRGPE